MLAETGDANKDGFKDDFEVIERQMQAENVQLRRRLNRLQDGLYAPQGRSRARSLPT